MANWDPWTGCRRHSAGCLNCYYYGKYYGTEKEKNPPIERSAQFRRPVEKDAKGSYVMKKGMVFTCFRSDFFLEEADAWRPEAWEIIKERSDLKFMFLTKRIERASQCFPRDWGKGYDNVEIGCTCEDQETADFRLPIFVSLPIKHRLITCSPLLARLDLTPYLDERVESVTVGGESGKEARVCDYSWILDIRDQCKKAGIPFWFKQTGGKLLKDGVLYEIPYRLQHAQAKKAGLNL